MQREIPMMFSGATVRALVNGSKTQTRRPATPALRTIFRQWIAGQPMAIWAREPWALLGPDGQEILGSVAGKPAEWWAGATPVFTTTPDLVGLHWRPSIHMPKQISRLTLPIVDMGIERLGDITKADAIAEGIEPVGSAWRDYMNSLLTPSLADARDSYKSLWELINGKGAWRNDTPVLVLKFTVQRINISKWRPAEAA